MGEKSQIEPFCQHDQPKVEFECITLHSSDPMNLLMLLTLGEAQEEAI